MNEAVPIIEAEIALARPLPPVLGVGAFLKNSVCAIDGQRALITGSLGTLDNADNISRFKAAVEELCRHLGGRPSLVAHDLHPDYPSTRHAKALGLPTLAVQHHHAHVAAVAAEHGLVGPLIGICLDGFGLGPGNQAWGGELLYIEGSDFARIGHLSPLPQPGGDVAVREPWRMAAAALWRMGRADEIATRFADQPAAPFLPTMIERHGNAPLTSSAGRLFDAACGLLGVHPVAEFEGQAPMALERMVTAPRVMPGGWTNTSGVLDLLPVLTRLMECQPAEGADLFHGSLIAAVSDWAAQAAADHGVNEIVLSGGVFLNKVLARGVAETLAKGGFRPLEARQLSPGDSALSLGQAWVAGLAAATGRI